MVVALLHANKAGKRPAADPVAALDISKDPCGHLQLILLRSKTSTFHRIVGPSPSMIMLTRTMIFSLPQPNVFGL